MKFCLDARGLSIFFAVCWVSLLYVVIPCNDSVTNYCLNYQNYEVKCYGIRDEFLSSYRH